MLVLVLVVHGSKSRRGTVRPLSSSPWPPALLSSALPEVSLRGSSLCPCGEASFERLLKQGYRGDSPIALERYAVLRRAIFSETNQPPTCAHEIKKPADIQRPTDDIPEDALPSSGKIPATLTVRVPGPNATMAAVALKTRVFTHIVTEAVAIPTGEFILIGRGHSRTYI